MLQFIATQYLTSHLVIFMIHLERPERQVSDRAPLSDIQNTKKPSEAQNQPLELGWVFLFFGGARHAV